MNIIQITQKFPTENDAVKYFESIRWKGKPKCVYCSSANLSRSTKDLRLHCKDCNKTFSVTTGTNLHQTHIPLQTWLYAFSIIGDAKKGLSALQLHRNLNITYKTTWTMYHKIRDLMAIENDGITLNDVVEFDTTQVDVSMRKCQAESKGTPDSIPKLDKLKAKYEARGFEFKEGKYKKPCKVGNQKRGEGASLMKISGAV